MATVSIRYIVDDVDAAIDFYCDHLGFRELMHPAPTFAMLIRGDLRLVLSAPGGGPGGGQAMPDGTVPRPGGWNRFSVEVDDLDRAAAGLRAGGVHFRSGIIDGVGGRQIVVDDPSGNPVELFEPFQAEARLTASGAGATNAPHTNATHTNATHTNATYEVHPIGRVESVLADLVDAPNQGDQGAPDAWLVINSDVREGIRDLAAGTEVLVLTWLHRARRNELATHPGNNPTAPELGVFSTRSPNRPNPIGLHRVSIMAVEDDKLQVRPLEAIDGTPIVDIKPVIGADEG